MDDMAMREYIAARRDVALVGGDCGRNAIATFGDESVTVPAGDGNAVRMVLLANAYEATDPKTGEKSLFLVKALSPLAYCRVEVGHTYAPVGCDGATDEMSLTPAVESFPMALHSTNLLRGRLSERLVLDGEYDDAPSLKFAVLVVALGQGKVPDSEWSVVTCGQRLADMHSGDLSSVTMNMDGLMSVEVVGRIHDFSRAANEAVVAFDAYARRMWALHGSGWESEVGLSRFSRHLSGNILYSLPGFVLQEGDGDNPRKVAMDMLVPMRIRAFDSTWEKGSPIAPAEMQCDGIGKLRVMVALAAISDQHDGFLVRMSRRCHGESVERLRSIGEESMILGSVIADGSEARRIAEVLRELVSDGHEEDYSKVLAEALLGSPHGHMVMAEAMPMQGMRSSSVAALLLLVALVATERRSLEWADLVSSEVRDIVGSVAYAKTLAEALHDVSPFLDLYDEDVLLCGDLDSVTPDWGAIASRIRESLRDRVEEGEGESLRYDQYGDDWYDDDEDWYESDRCLFDTSVCQGDEWEPVASDADRERANRFVDLCHIRWVGRVAMSHLDPTGMGMLLSEYPVLDAILAGDGTPLPVHNDVVAAAFEAFRDLVTEDGFDGGADTGITLPGVIMDDGSVMGCHIERDSDGKCVAHLTCDGDRDCMMVKADMDRFDDPEDIMEILFDIATSTDDDGR